MGVRARGNGDVGADRAEADVIEGGRRGLGRAGVDVQRGRVRRDVDDADLGDGLDSGDALATGKARSQERERDEPAGPLNELGDGKSHGCALRRIKTIKPIVNAGRPGGCGHCALRCDGSC